MIVKKRPSPQKTPSTDVHQIWHSRLPPT